ncbi:MAG: preprotein translocase subunit SecE [bacterium]|nr:preprotein translocase subunit SecE [bacterium]
MALKEYIKETGEEMKHVSWPTRKQIIGYTIIVIVLSVLTAMYLGAFDYIFHILIKLII